MLVKKSSLKHTKISDFSLFIRGSQNKKKRLFFFYLFLLRSDSYLLPILCFYNGGKYCPNV